MSGNKKEGGRAALLTPIKENLEQALEHVPQLQTSRTSACRTDRDTGVQVRPIEVWIGNVAASESPNFETEDWRVEYVEVLEPYFKPIVFHRRERKVERALQ